MKYNLTKMLAVLLVAVTLLGVISGCNTAEPETTKPGSSVGSTENPTTDGTATTTGSTETPNETDSTTGTTDDAPTGNDIISSPENTEPTTEPTEHSTEPSTEPSIPSGETSEPTACAHKYGSWSTTKAATCSAAGSKERKCSTCGYVQKESIATLSHSYGAWSTTKQATCGAKGEKSRTCANCGKTETQTIAALDHKYGSWSTTKAATCDTNGTKTRKCSGCGKTETQSIAATGHVWDGGKVTTQPTSCSAMGIKTYTCTKCSRTKTEQIKGNHTFGDWKYEEYTYKQDGVDRPSHRKVRACTKCGYKEYGNTPDHSCKQGSKNHTITTVKEGTCTTKAIMRSTCKICGWYVEYEGKKGQCNWVDKKVHLSDYGTYTNELDATVSECKSCGERSVVYHKGEGWSDYNRYRFNLTVNQGNATNAQTPVTDDFGYYDNPKQQTVKRDFKYDSDGYVKQFTVHWWYNGSRYSQVIKCGKGELEAWFAEYGLEAGEGYKHSIKISGTKIVPYKVSWTS